MVQGVKEPVWSLRQLGSRLWRGFDPWPGNLHTSRAWEKKKSSGLERDKVRFDLR